VGIVIGEVISMGVLFRVTAGFEPWLSFATVGAVGFVFSFFFLFMVKEPRLREDEKPEKLLLPSTPLTIHQPYDI